MNDAFAMNEKAFRATLDSYAAQKHVSVAKNSALDGDLRELNECVVQQTLYASVIAVTKGETKTFVVQTRYLDACYYGAECISDYFNAAIEFEHYVFETREAANAMLFALLNCGDADV